MSITRDLLNTELASLDQQLAQARDTIAATERVRRETENRIEAISGARQAYEHLLRKLEATPESVESVTLPGALEDGTNGQV